MDRPKLVKLSDELENIRQRWQNSERKMQDLIYASEFGPRYAPLFSDLPLHGSKLERPCFKALISVLGFSWQPVALMAAWAKPQYLLLIGTPESVTAKVGSETVTDAISRISGIAKDRFEFCQIDDFDEAAIYLKSRDFISKHNIRPHEIAVDPTGGKKSMSASVALAGFLSGAWIVYVDYAEYLADGRIPLAGTEFPRLLRNPLEVFGVLDFEKIREAFRRGNYEEASNLSDSLADRLYEPREAEALGLMAKAYGAWHRFRIDEAVPALGKLAAHIERFAREGKWQWASEAITKIRLQIPTVRNLSEVSVALKGGSKPESVEAAIPIILNHIASAERNVTHAQISSAILLVYASLERYIDLCLWVLYGLIDEKPDYSKVSLNMDKFHEVGRRFFGKKYQKKKDLPSPISLSSGVQLLAALRPDLVNERFFGRIQGLMNERNKCEFEHGLCSRPIEKEGVLSHLKIVKEIVQAGMPAISIETELEKFRFPNL